MSAKIIGLQPRPSNSARYSAARIRGDVDIFALLGTLEQAGLCGTFDGECLVIEPAEEECAILEWEPMRWYNSLSPTERAHWHEVAGSAAPTDAWAAWKATRDAQPA